MSTQPILPDPHWLALDMLRLSAEAVVVLLLPCRPPRRQSVGLRKVASKAIAIDDTHLAASLFPDPIVLPTGNITKPLKW